MQAYRDELRLELTKTRLKVIQSETALKTLFDRILRAHIQLKRILERHPEYIKNKKMKEPELSMLKLKLLREDEDLRDQKESIIKLHRKLEEELLKNPEVKELTDKLASVERRLDSLK